MNAPQEIREFYFVLSEEEAGRVGDSLDSLMRSGSYLEAEKLLEGAKKVKGLLTIKHVRLGNLIGGERAWIDSMQFDVELQFPSESHSL